MIRLNSLEGNTVPSEKVAFQLVQFIHLLFFGPILSKGMGCNP